MNNQITKKALLIILDGFGIRDDNKFNAINNAFMPNYNKYLKEYAYGQISASGRAVGLPKSQFGNSEVGHLNIGAGRIVVQDITQIDLSIENHSINTNQTLLSALNKTRSGNLHLMGLLSDGGVHCHINHILALIKLASNQANIKKIWLHMFLDGRDTPPKSANIFVEQLLNYIKDYPKSKIATIGGRYYAMDRDSRYDRLKFAYDAIALGLSSEPSYSNIKDIIENSYANGITDEFIKMHVLSGYNGIQPGDSMIFANFRSDRAIELTDALTNHDFKGFKTNKLNLSAFVSMTMYDPKFNNVSVAFTKDKIVNTLGEYLSNLNLKQLRIAETEKYPHVTYFLNGGNKIPYNNEDRILIDSPRDVATYDQKPEMSLPSLTTQLMNAIIDKKYDVIIANFANGDMVGHTGDYKAAVSAVEAIDVALGKIIPLMLKHHGEVLIVADHGNCEEMFDPKTNQPHTQHTTNMVPFLYIGRSATIKPGGSLQDIAPSILSICGLDIPKEMTGKNLINFER